MTFPYEINKSIVMVGLMGAGKSSIGRRLAAALGIPFTDADEEIVKAAGCSIEDIFRIYGEESFRDCERRVIGRLMEDGPRVLATGGGAFVDPETRAKIKKDAISLWLRADLDILVERTGRRGGRPLLENGDSRAILGELIEKRYPIYAEADIVVESRDEPHEVTVENAVKALEAVFSPPLDETQA